jgi:hypothetical protein
MSIQLSVQARNAQLVQKRFEDLTAETPKIGRQQIRTVMDRIKRRMQAYPPEPEGQSVAESHPVLGTIYRHARGRYQRTGLLGASWAIEDTADRNGYKITNNAARRGKAYAKYVVGNAYGLRQAWMHKGRWQLLRDVVDTETQKLPAEVLDSISIVARRTGF